MHVLMSLMFLTLSYIGSARLFSILHGKKILYFIPFLDSHLLIRIRSF